MRPLILCLTLALFIATLPSTPLQADSNVATFADGHTPAMKRAIAKAQKHLPKVLARHMDAKGRISSALSFKVALEIPGGNENIWVDKTRKTAAGFTGKLANNPRFLKGKRLGSNVRFSQAQIIDWALSAADGRSYGHFTTRIIIRDLPADQASQIKSILTNAPLPAGY